MPPLEVMDCTDKAVMWPIVSHDRYGEPVIDKTSPQEISVRWNWVHRVEVSPDNKPLTIDATCGTTFQLREGTLLWYGALEDYSNDAVTADNPIMVVLSRSMSKDVKGRNARYEFNLAKYHKTMADIQGTE